MLTQQAYQYQSGVEFERGGTRYLRRFKEPHDFTFFKTKPKGKS
jgi:hypothetical protein